MCILQRALRKLLGHFINAIFVILFAAGNQSGRSGPRASSPLSGLKIRTGPEIAMLTDVWFSKIFSKLSKPNASSLRHDFVIGPLRQHPLFAKPARLYYCHRCKWSFLVSGRKVAVLDSHGTILANAEGQRRFDTFEDGACPVLEVLSLDAEKDPSKVVISERRVLNGSRNLAPGNVYPWTRRTWPVFFVLPRLRKDLRTHT